MLKHKSLWGKYKSKSSWPCVKQIFLIRYYIKNTSYRRKKVKLSSTKLRTKETSSGSDSTAHKLGENICKLYIR